MSIQLQSIHQAAGYGIGQNYINDKITTAVKLPNGTTQAVTCTIQDPITDYESKVGNIQDLRPSGYADVHDQLCRYLCNCVCHPATGPQRMAYFQHRE